jgi:hypothetical protein
MLCRLTNKSAATRIVHDNLHQNVAKNYHEAMSKPKCALSIEALEEAEGLDAADVDEPKGDTFTLREGEGTRPELKEAQSLKEARGVQGNQPPPAVAEGQAAPANHPNPIQNAAEQNAKPKEEPAPLPEPKTAAELLARIDEFGDTDQVRLAAAVLKKRLPQGAKPAQIMAMLAAQAKREAE